MDNKMTALNGMDLSMVNGGEIHGMDAMKEAEMARKLYERQRTWNSIVDFFKKIFG